MNTTDQPSRSPLEGPDELVPLCSPDNTVELTMICSLLRSEGIFHTVFNEFFGAFKVGPSIPLYNQRLVLVPASELEHARDLLVPVTPSETSCDESGFTFLEKLRIFLEASLFVWFVPAPRRSSRNRPKPGVSAEP